MNTKNIEAVIAPREPHFVGDGFRVHNFIPSFANLSMRRMDPFIMMDYNSKFNFPATDVPKGVGVHPHRGFETVTIAYQGSVSHHDSAGGGGTIHQGDVQWMTAASGVLHKEYHAEEFYKKGGIFQMVQLWVNLPAKDKMSAPKYQAIEHQNIPTVEVENGFVEVIAGEYNGVKGSASTFSPVHMLNAKLNLVGKADFKFPANYNTIALVIEGEIKVNGNQIVETDHFVLFENKGENFSIEATEENTVVLILSGEPLNEPIASYGPFVMNTQEEIREAFEDYNKGEFGTLED
ncbi:pirin family protein [Faecalibacter rhinopitheci]|uniref:Pirin family protein n=1 Tax=Faecalibacter rhinopitheci TaxID=2779678 RepID=A0A8J7KI37_9FLAO|nr:pirin family protein [Faecalibacter rhinopitheci]MBF0597066.1 pirin family protein [Faecalibacter rhinopitheci]